MEDKDISLALDKLKDVMAGKEPAGIFGTEFHNDDFVTFKQSCIGKTVPGDSDWQFNVGDYGIVLRVQSDGGLILRVTDKNNERPGREEREVVIDAGSVQKCIQKKSNLETAEVDNTETELSKININIIGNKAELMYDNKNTGIILNIITAAPKEGDVIQVTKDQVDAKSKEAASQGYVLTKQNASDDESNTYVLRKKTGILESKDQKESSASIVDYSNIKDNREDDRMENLISYVEGTNFSDSFFTVISNNKEVRYVAADIIPVAIQEKILNEDPDVVEPEEVLAQLNAEFISAAAFETWAKKRKIIKEKIEKMKEAKEKAKKTKEAKEEKKDDKKEAKEKKEKNAALETPAVETETVVDKLTDVLKEAATITETTRTNTREAVNMRTAAKAGTIYENMALNPKEIDNLPKVNETNISLDPKESKKDAPKMAGYGSAGSAIKKFYNRLPSRSLSDKDELVQGLNPKEAELNILKAELAAKDKQLKELSAKEDKRAKGELIFKIVSSMTNLNLVTEDKQDETIESLSHLDVSALSKMLDIFSKKENSIPVRANLIEGNIPQILETSKETGDDCIDKLSMAFMRTK